MSGPLEALVSSHGEAGSGDIEVRLHKDKDRIGDVLDGVREAGFRLEDIRMREPSLEDVFVEMTGGEA